MTRLDDHCRRMVKALGKINLARTLKHSAPAADGVTVVQDGRSYISFSGNDYLGLSHHAEVVAAATDALQKYGTGAGASRLVTGNHPLYAPLEKQLARMKKAEAALVFGSGYLTNVGVIPALVGKGDVIFADKLVHACLLDGAILSGAVVKRFRHNDPKHLETLLIEHRQSFANALILVDHVYSMDGDIAPLGPISKIAREHEAWLMVDDAHGLGIIPHHSDHRVDIWMGTLSKSAGSYGGYVIAKQHVIDYLISTARSLLFSTGLPPSACAAAYTALQIMDDETGYGKRAVKLAAKLCDELKLPRTKTAIVPIVIGDEKKALEASEALKKRGILAVAIRPPTVPAGTARLRLTFSASHTDEQVAKLIEALQAENIRPKP